MGELDAMKYTWNYKKKGHNVFNIATNETILAPATEQGPLQLDG